MAFRIAVRPICLMNSTVVRNKKHYIFESSKGISEPFTHLIYTNGIGLSLMSSKLTGSYTVVLACSADDYSLLINIDLNSGDIIMTSKSKGKWLSREFLASPKKSEPVNRLDIDIQSNKRGFALIFQSKTTRRYQYQTSMCKPQYVSFGGQAELKNIRTESNEALTLLSLNRPEVSAIETNLQQTVFSLQTSLALSSTTCPNVETPLHGFKAVQGAETIVDCAPGFVLTGSSARLCRNGAWSGREARCKLTPVVRTMGDVSVSAGAGVKFQCHFAGDPFPAVSWKINGRPLDLLPTSGNGRVHVETVGGRSLLEVRKVEEKDFGVYECVARNEYGTKSESFQVKKGENMWHSSRM
eukprot:m.151344 g.151344  ORF g.151344 m.151344 type:complete len:355 (+) comp38582_c0_seq7:2502-3566(+)